ncbi:putative membrane protein [Bartonella australis AUST/NH1]|uniref:Putative membrane protein n=1 Tax=Bartonella australis (strain Aust/NH1) TaxID=1094489 RepID=M1PDU4_BARAA|nr:glutamine amidotransferase [Bartonella australis]AGF74771.1 putative membrane protein [Bartonella australis AUST/NH1]
MIPSITFQPFLPISWLLFLGGLTTLFIIIGLITQRDRALLRSMASASLILVLLNPTLIKEQREPVKSTVGIVIDHSESQTFGTRAQDTDTARAQLINELSHYTQFELRFIEVGKSSDNHYASSTNLFNALAHAISDIPPSRYAGTILITDGQIHDIPSLPELNHNAPINALITGKKNEFDRQIKFVSPPRFALVNKPQTLSILVEDKGKIRESVPAQANITVSVNGQDVGHYSVTPGVIFQTEITLSHAEKNVIQVTTDTYEGELSLDNNHAITIIEGIKENLRVLLISGAPYNGERTWRDLLKSDSNIDLVHFTILRPAEKADDTPSSQLSLVVFPTTKLFVEDINNFDLIILDGYQHSTTFPLIYYDYIAQYVKQGGALLMVTGPEFTEESSLAKTPLISVLPALPSGAIIQKPFRPTLTKEGERHPVTRDLATPAYPASQWGRWLRQIAIQNTGKSIAVMKGADEEPLLLLSRVGEGRVGMLLSDESWLWARGFEGGGPYAALYRRISHWLMKEPELEEEKLSAISDHNRLTIRRQTLQNHPGPTEVIFPSGKKENITLTKEKEGIFTGAINTDEIGLFTIRNGDQTVLSPVGISNNLEFSDLISTEEKLAPISKHTGGHIIRLHNEKKNDIHLPPIKLIQSQTGQVSPFSHSIVLKEATETRSVNISHFSLFSGFFALLTCLLLLGGTWYRENY